MNSPVLQPFQVLFDDAEKGPLENSAYGTYGTFGLPDPPPNRPWIYTNFVQSLDGITTLLGEHGSGGEISQSRDDRWLMDLLRAHADALLMGMNTLLEEQRSRGPESRGISFRVADPELRRLRQRLGKGRERNVFVTRGIDIDLSRFKVFDCDETDTAILTSPAGAERLGSQKTDPRLLIVPAGKGENFDLSEGVRKLRTELGAKYVLCEGGPTLYGSLARADLINEKFVTVSPVEVGQLVPPEQKRLASEMKSPVLLRPTIFGGPGFTRETISYWQWMSCRKAGDHQFNRYRRKR